MYIWNNEKRQWADKDQSGPRAHVLHSLRPVLPRTWKTRSINSPMINAMLRLLKPAEQNPTGKEDFAAYSAFSDHIWPPWLHSQTILSFLS